MFKIRLCANMGELACALKNDFDLVIGLRCARSTTSRIEDICGGFCRYYHHPSIQNKGLFDIYRLRVGWRRTSVLD
jgi:hypothetical protein